MGKQERALKVVSLIPSVTDSIFTLGFGDRLVGVTDFCPIRKEHAEHIIRVGGPKSVSVENILYLSPDLVITNKEENSREQVEALSDNALEVWVSTPASIREGIDFLWELVRRLGGESRVVLGQIRSLEQLWETTGRSASHATRMPVFCPIWFEHDQSLGSWWMTFNNETYCHDVLTICGGRNVFSQRKRMYPLEADLGFSQPEEYRGRDTRYPRVTAQEIVQKNPQVIILPDDPYNFSKQDQQVLLDAVSMTDAVINNRVFQIDGTWISWYGTRTARALVELPAFLNHMP
ncbi:MAG: ABC transporter substrate-binding protein [Anaerolineales bacterium]|nr:ABC transporter substrate-binding protein [Anaerolineales bacterium]